MANSPLKPETLERYVKDVDRMAAQLENSEHHEAADQAREFQHELERLIASLARP